jgi:hypothetical protein
VALTRCLPHSQGAVSRGEDEIVVGRQQLQLVSYAELRNHGIDRADLQPSTATSIAQIRGVNVILPVRRQEREGHKPFNDVFTCTRAGKSLQQFLQNETCDYDRVTAFESVTQYAYLGGGGSLVAAEC